MGVEGGSEYIDLYQYVTGLQSDNTVIKGGGEAAHDLFIGLRVLDQWQAYTSFSVAYPRRHAGIY